MEASIKDFPLTLEDLKHRRIWDVDVQEKNGTYHWYLPFLLTYSEAHQFVQSYFEMLGRQIERQNEGQWGECQYWFKPMTGYSAANIHPNWRILDDIQQAHNTVDMLERLEVHNGA